MNAKALKQTSVASMLCVTILKDPTFVVVLVVTRVMEETAQVNIIRVGQSEDFIVLFIALFRLEVYRYFLLFSKENSSCAGHKNSKASHC